MMHWSLLNQPGGACFPDGALHTENDDLLAICAPMPDWDICLTPGGKMSDVLSDRSLGLDRCPSMAGC